MNDLTIVTSCSGYGKYLMPWAQSIVAQTQHPGEVIIVTHGSTADNEHAGHAMVLLLGAGINTMHEHYDEKLDFGVARNRAVELSRTEWVMHLDCDDQLMPHAIADIAAIAPDADVVQLGYERAGDTKDRPTNRLRTYHAGDGIDVLRHIAPASGVSPFRRRLWEQSPYREDLMGAWDTALWIGFARLGARFRPTSRPVFWYWHHPDSIFTKRRLTYDWTHAHTVAMLKRLRRNDSGVAFIVPLTVRLSEHRQRAWEFIERHYGSMYPDVPVIPGTCVTDLWCKGVAVQDALEQCTAEYLIIVDADCVVPKSAIDWALAQITDPAVSWVIPHDQVLRLNQQTTLEYLHGQYDERWRPGELQLARKAYTGYAGGGALVVRRWQYEAVGGFPKSFRGWGGEDQTLALVLDTMLGPHRRGTANLIHLWHEPQITRSESRIVSRNQFQFRALLTAAQKRGCDGLWEMLHSLPGAPTASSVEIKPWHVRGSPELHDLSITGRNSLFAKRVSR